MFVWHRCKLTSRGNCDAPSFQNLTDHPSVAPLKPVHSGLMTHISNAVSMRIVIVVVVSSTLCVSGWCLKIAPCEYADQPSLTFCSWRQGGFSSISNCRFAHVCPLEHVCHCVIPIRRMLYARARFTDRKIMTSAAQLHVHVRADLHIARDTQRAIHLASQSISCGLCNYMQYTPPIGATEKKKKNIYIYIYIL